jgi:hypothetical protein
MSRRRAAASLAVVVLSATVWVATCNHASTPSAPPSPSPSPEATPPVSQGGGRPPCTLPHGTGSGQNCPRQISNYLPEVERSLDRLVARRPEIFDLHAYSGCGTCYKIRDVAAYIEGMLEEVRTHEGACATWDGEELAIKRTNDFSDQYDILTFENFIRRDNGSYRATCYPAWF